MSVSTRLRTDSEHAPVAEESRNGDVAAFIEHLPLRRIGCEPRPIGGEVFKAELTHTLVQPLADLAAHFAKTPPAQIKLRQRPLQESRAIHVVH